jgi:hypothetical protein
VDHDIQTFFVLYIRGDEIATALAAVFAKNNFIGG